MPSARTLLASLICLSATSVDAAPATSSASTTLELVEVTGIQDHQIGVGTGLNLSLSETPQSVSVIPRAVLDDFNLNTINEVLESTPGVTVEQVETDRTYFTSRGFEINNFQTDGVGVPLHWSIYNGDLDTFRFERVEVLRGASGLMAGAGNPAATVNLVRKRPTTNTEASVQLSAGRWDNYRIDTDLSGSLNDNVRGRFVASYQDQDSYLRDYEKQLSAFYGVIDTQLTEATLLTAGISRQKSTPNSPLWGALTLAYADGTPTDFDVSASTAADWAYWDVTETQSFAELEHEFSATWKGRLTYTHTDTTEDSALLYAYLPGTALDPDTNEGLLGWASQYHMDYSIDLIDASVNGSFMLGGRSHDLVVGASWSQRDTREVSLYDYTSGNGFPLYGDFTQWTGATPYPSFTADADNYPDYSDFTDTQKAVFAATRLRLTDQLSAIGGVRVVDFTSKGFAYGESEVSKTNGKTLPYGGLVYDLTEQTSLYASYSETFLPQTDVDANNQRLAPTEGKSTEAGIKIGFNDGAALLTLAAFENEHDNLSEYAGFSNGQSIYQGVDYSSDGYEAELSGQITPAVYGSFSFTHLSIEDSDGNRARNYIPRDTVKLLASWIPDALPQFKIGGNVKWQSDIYVDIAGSSVQTATRVTQDSYTLVDLFASYAFSPQLSGALNLNNVTDEKYFQSLNYDQAYYAAPRNLTVSVTWTY